MPIESLFLEEEITDRLQQNGYVLIPGWRREETTVDLAHSIGVVVDMQALLPKSNIPTVQILEPRPQTESPKNRYSGVFGLNDFPLHSDLAHWKRPPRYFLLRCQKGSQAVATKILSASTLSSAVDRPTLKRALVRPRSVGSKAHLCLLPLVFGGGPTNIRGFRWDSIFLVPMNSAANRLTEFMHTQAWDLSKSLNLVERGDTLIIDNWRVLHGRSKILSADIDRRLERVYLWEIYK